MSSPTSPRRRDQWRAVFLLAAAELAGMSHWFGASAAMAVSGACCLAVGFFFGGSAAALLAVAAIWGATVVADSAQFSACVTELADPRCLGTALTLQICLGFLLTTASIALVGRIQHSVGWRFAFAVLALGPALGVVAMLRLRNELARPSPSQHRTAFRYEVREHNGYRLPACNTRRIE